MPEGRVGVGGADVAGGTECFADILRQIPTVCEPRAVFADGKGTGGNGLGGVPGDEPESGVITTGEVAAGNLQVATIDVALVERYTAVDCYLFKGAAAHGIVLAFNNRVGDCVGECDRAIFCVVNDAPNAR